MKTSLLLEGYLGRTKALETAAQSAYVRLFHSCNGMLSQSIEGAQLRGGRNPGHPEMRGRNLNWR